MVGNVEGRAEYQPLSPEERQQALVVAQAIRQVAEGLSEGQDEFYRTYPDGRPVIVKRQGALPTAHFHGADLLIQVLGGM